MDGIIQSLAQTTTRVLQAIKMITGQYGRQIIGELIQVKKDSLTIISMTFRNQIKTGIMATAGEVIRNRKNKKIRTMMTGGIAMIRMTVIRKTVINLQIQPHLAKLNSSRSIAAYKDHEMEVNWITKQATTHIKQQGICGSCWTYNAVGIVESYFIIMKNTKMDLSQQQLVDCQTKGSYGCEGRFSQLALKWVTANGLVAEQKYPYKGAQKKCAHPSGPYKIPSSKQVKGRTSIEAYLRKGHVAAAVYVDDYISPFYEKGIFNKCIAKQTNHAIIIVGFTKDYWIIRNSWGRQWGEQGHMRIKKNLNKNNACSIMDEVDVINY